MYATQILTVQSRTVGTLSILTGLKGQVDGARCCPDDTPQIIHLARRTGASKKLQETIKHLSRA